MQLKSISAHFAIHVNCKSWLPIAFIRHMNAGVTCHFHCHRNNVAGTQTHTRTDSVVMAPMVFMNEMQTAG